VAEAKDLKRVQEYSDAYREPINLSGADLSAAEGDSMGKPPTPHSPRDLAAP
jgi:hypothetical protein